MKFQNSLFLVSLAASLLPQSAIAQNLAPSDQPVSGSCVASPSVETFKREACEMSTEDGKVPNGFRLVIEHVSVACATHPDRGIFTLALITKSSSSDRGKMTHIPISPQAARPGQVRLTGAQMVRIYGGSGTTPELIVSTWDTAPSGFTTCELSFSGLLKRATE